MLYDVKCKSCGHEFSEVTTVDKRNEIKCEECGKDTEVLIHNPKHYKHFSWAKWRAGRQQ